MIKHFAPYDQVAEEYYDSSLHPTCSNFRQLGHLYISELRRREAFEREFRYGQVLETGAGFSLSAEIMARDFSDLKNLTIQDMSEKMLSHSVRWQNWLKDIYVSDARQLQAADRTYDLIFSILADPYNDRGLWEEVSRVLKEGGLWVVTTPSNHWAKKFRGTSDAKLSHFITKEGKEVFLPSITYPASQFIGGVEKEGPLFRNFMCYTTDDVAGPVSKKLYAKGSGGSVLDCFLFEKTSS